MKNIQDLFINYDIVKIDENGLCNNHSKKNHYNKVFFNLYFENNSPSNENFVTCVNNEKGNGNDENEKKFIITDENNDKIDTVFVNNKIDPKINKSLSLFSIQYNNSLNNFILTSLTDEIFFSLEIWSNKNFYLEHSKRYYIQLGDIVLSVTPNNYDKNIKIKILNLNNEDKINTKYFFDIKKLPIQIGRIGCNINIDKDSISKIHLIISYDTCNNQFFIRDNYSTNGSLMILKKGKDVKLEDKMFFFLAKGHFILKR